jgi:pterin-4a-carbinolamine dehydratase
VVLDASTRERLRQQVPGWRVVAAGADAAAAIQQDWTVKDADSAQRLVDSIGEISRSLGHAPASLEAVGGTTVVARLATEALGELPRSQGFGDRKSSGLPAPTLRRQQVLPCVCAQACACVACNGLPRGQRRHCRPPPHRVSQASCLSILQAFLSFQARLDNPPPHHQATQPPTRLPPPPPNPHPPTPTRWPDRG